MRTQTGASISDKDKENDPYRRLEELGLQLPPVSAPKGVYVPGVRAGNLIYLAGTIPLKDGILLATGRVGDEVAPQTARALSRTCALAALAAVEQLTGSLRAVAGIVKLTGYVTCTDEFTDLDYVADGASELMEAVFGTAGRPARSVVGMRPGPLNTPVEMDFLVQSST